MRIAYIAPYQSETLRTRRPIVRNLSLAGSQKIEVITNLLSRSGHDVEILSQGEVIDRSATLYPSFDEPASIHLNAPVRYASALPIRFVNGTWSSLQLARVFRRLHDARPFDLVIAYNTKVPQVHCARKAMKQFSLPVVFEYEDDHFVDVRGNPAGSSLRGFSRGVGSFLNQVSGVMAASPHLLSQVSGTIPKLLLPGVVGDDLATASKNGSRHLRQNRVLFSGTHYFSKGIEPLIHGWQQARIPGWELHITGSGALTRHLKQLASGDTSVIFHGLVDRPRLVELMTSARICVNPHDLSRTPGNVFAFKLIEYIAAGAHVISTPMGPVDKDIEAGITYIPDNNPETIAAALREIIQMRGYDRTASKAAIDKYGPTAISRSLETLIQQVMTASNNRNK